MKVVLALLAFCFSNFAMALEFDSDVPATVKSQMIEDLKLVGSFQGDSASEIYKRIFEIQTMTGSNLVTFFNSHVEEVGMDSCGGGPSVAACVYGASSKMWLTPNFVKNNIPQIYRISMIFHEARHTESYNWGWGHATCPTPYRDEKGQDIVGIISGAKMAGQPACDNTVMGSYGLQAVLLKNVEKHCDNCTEKLKQDGQLFGDDTIKRISNLSERQKIREDLNK